MEHSADSVEPAQMLMGELPEKTTGIVARHMWPVG